MLPEPRGDDLWRLRSLRDAWKLHGNRTNAVQDCTGIGRAGIGEDDVSQQSKGILAITVAQAARAEGRGLESA